MVSVIVSALAQQTIANLQSRNPGVVQAAILFAVGCFEFSHGHPQPAEPAVAYDPASTEELVLLQETLITLVNAPLDDNVESYALFALGKSHDPKLVQFFVWWLANHRHRNPFGAHQALIGLNNHGEPTLSLEGRLSSNEPDLTLRQADVYLRSINAI